MLAITSSYRFSCNIHQLKNSNLLTTQKGEFKKYGLRNWQFQSEGSLVYKPVRLNCAPNDATYIGTLNDLETDQSTKYEEKDTQMDFIEEIRHDLSTMGDGRISVSPYDTAWVSFIQDNTTTNNNNGTTSKKPLFPSCLQWIVDNQLGDGSWGDEHVFCIYDRLVNTIACVVSLTFWNTSLHRRNKGVMFIKENLKELEKGEVENMTCGFEFVFPTLLEKAQQLDIDLPYDAPVLKDIYARREEKFRRIPREVIHSVPTTVLFSLEGFRDLDWERLFKFQMPDGSFLTSPASTAVAFMETNDEKCFTFLQYVVEECKGAVSASYPVDLQGRLWAIDRLQRLGISYYFEEEFKDLLDHVYRYWNGEIGIFVARNSDYCDADDTCMAIRILRLHGYDVSPDVLYKFKDGDQFFCFRGELNMSPTVMFNLYRCSQALFPGEEILEEAKNFTTNFLQQCLENNQSSDKWLIAKDIPGEIRYALEFPWYASLPRVESRIYIDQYGGADDVWIGKILYRLPDVSSNVYLQAAKLDYNRCQSQHHLEWLIMQEWFEECNLQQFGISKEDLLVSFFLAAASIFEVDKSRQRLAWAKSSILCKMITSYLNDQEVTIKNSLLMNFNKSSDMSKINGNVAKEMMVLNNLGQFLHQLEKETYEDLGKDIHHQLHNVWEKWLMSLMEENSQEDGELLVHTINLSAGHMTCDETLSKHTNKACSMLSELQKDQVTGSSKTKDIEYHMQSIVKLVFSNNTSPSNNMNQTYFAVAKTFYYTAHVSEEIINFHISKMLFQEA